MHYHRMTTAVHTNQQKGHNLHVIEG